MSNQVFLERECPMPSSSVLQMTVHVGVCVCLEDFEDVPPFVGMPLLWGRRGITCQSLSIASALLGAYSLLVLGLSRARPSGL